MIFTRLFSAFEIVPARDPLDHPIMDALECNSNKTGLATELKNSTVAFRVRDRSELESGWRRVRERRQT
jgi:phenylacetate 2-hydroxylase